MAVRDDAAKGKIERFFKRVRDQFLSRNLDLSLLEALNRQFTAWVESEYNAVEHSALGMKPIDRFGLDLKRIRFLLPNEVNDELFNRLLRRRKADHDSILLWARCALQHSDRIFGARRTKLPSERFCFYTPLIW